jgi:stress response protein SCP2
MYVGWQQQDDAFIDMLHVGSNGDPAFDWYVNPRACRRLSPNLQALGIGDHPTREARVAIVESEPDRIKTLEAIQKRLPKYSVLLDQSVLDTSRPETLTNQIQFSFFSSEKPITEQAIHCVKIGGGDLDYVILTIQMTVLLPIIRYLTFEYNWKGTWGDKEAKLSTLIDTFKQHGLVCYWSGDKNANFGLWRITNCWQDYYDSNNWAHIPCASHVHRDVADLAKQMEENFLKTVQDSHVFA